MTSKDRPERAVELRRQAEVIAREKTIQSPEDPEALSPEETRKTLHELHVHQIELEMQNEELRTTQTELEISRARYFDLYDLAPIGYFTLSEQGLILEANLTAATLLDVARDTLVRRPLSQFILPEDQNSYYWHRKQLLETGKPQACELRMLKKDGTAFWAYLEATTARNADGQPVCRVVLSDIGDRKQAEEHQQRMQATLAHMARLAQVGEMAAEITHELGQPLFAILNYAKAGTNFLAREAPLDVARLSECVAKIAEIASAAGSIGKRMQSFARRAEQERSVCDMHDIIQEAISLVVFEASQSKVSVETEPSPNRATVLVIPVEIQQVLVNLLINAFDAMKETPFGMRRAVVRTLVDDDAVEVVVSDHGSGLPPKDGIRIFDAFVTTKPEGLGMGLAISSTIIENYEGKIWASANPTGGASFHFQLPLCRQTAMDAHDG